MKKIEKIYLLKNKKNLVDSTYIIYDNFTFRKYLPSKVLRDITEDAISKFIKQENMSKKDLINNKKIVIAKMSNKKREEFNYLLYEMSSYHLCQFFDRTISGTSFISAILSYLFNHFLVYEVASVDSFSVISLISLVLPKYSKYLADFEEKYLEINNRKKHNRRAATFVAISLFSAIDSMNIPSINTLPYYCEMNNTDIKDTGNYENLTTEEYHTVAVNTIFDNLYTNPYLSEKDLNILLGLKEYYMENPYLNYDKVFQKMLTVRIFERYNLTSLIVGSYTENKNIIYYYNNVFPYPDGCLLPGYDDIIEHEAIHMTGDLDNRILNEGMTSLLQSEYFCNGIQKDGYAREVFITKVLCEVIGSDTMLKAYSMENDNLIYQALFDIYQSEEKVNNIYEMMDKYVNSSNKDASLVGKNFILYLINGAPEEIEYDLTLRLLDIKSEKAYFSENYEEHLANRLIKEKVKR